MNVQHVYHFCQTILDVVGLVELQGSNTTSSTSMGVVLDSISIYFEAFFTYQKVLIAFFSPFTREGQSEVFLTYYLKHPWKQKFVQQAGPKADKSGYCC